MSGCNEKVEEPVGHQQPTPTLQIDGEPAPKTVPTATTPPRPDETVVALINGDSITREAWEQQVAQVHDYLHQQAGVDDTTPEGRSQLRQAARQVLEEMINEVLIRQAAARRDIAISRSQLDGIIERDIEAAGGQEAFDEWLRRNRMTLADYRQATELQLLTTALREELTSDLPAEQPQIHIRHILLSSEEEAREVLQKLEDGTPFTELAATHSIDPGTRDKGGALGWLPKNLLPATVEAVAWELGPGERSGIIQSEFGFHIIEVIEQDPSRPLTLEQLQTLQEQRWEKWLTAERQNALIKRWLNDG